MGRNGVCDTHWCPISTIFFLRERISISLDLYHSVFISWHQNSSICRELPCCQFIGTCLSSFLCPCFIGIEMMVGRLHQQYLYEAINCLFSNLVQQVVVDWYCKKMRVLITLIHLKCFQMSSFYFLYPLSFQPFKILLNSIFSLVYIE